MKSGDQAMRFGTTGPSASSRNERAGPGWEKGSRRSAPSMASRKRPRSPTLRAIGPCWPSTSNSLAEGPEGTRAAEGRRPTQPQKLAGLRNDPPMSEPWASQAVPETSAAPDPPDEPATERDVFQGLRVRPKTSLKVLAPAPNSGVFDLA